MNNIEEQTLEFEVLLSIYNEDFNDLSTQPMSCMVTLTEFECEAVSSICLKFILPRLYPQVPPTIEIPIRFSEAKDTWKNDLLCYLNTQAADGIGDAAIYNLVEAAREWLNNYKPQISEDDIRERQVDDATPAITDDVEGALNLLKLAKCAEGKWDYVIGLVGKPSSGKSTFFNAATRCNLAKVASHPFTTIEPNYGQAFYSITDSALKLGVSSTPAYGRPNDQERFVPLFLKDVAGLVPGAADGKGRGNRFLNDLCDADVLIHVVDASGTTNEIGEKAVLHNPADDVRWLNSEIHNWIFNNVREKWESIVKRPKKLFSMFTGYHATSELIYEAFAHAKIPLKNIEDALPHWPETILHRLVESFIQIRFPMLHVLNKSDCPTSSDNVKSLLQEFPSYHFIPVSALSECFLQNLNDKGLVLYHNNKVIIDKEGLSMEEKQKVELWNNVLVPQFGGTNVLKALNEAVMLKPPVYAFPVHDLNTLVSCGGSKKSRSNGILRDCISLKPGTTVHGLYEVMLHHHYISGKYIRAEALYQDGNVHIVRKDERINEKNCILKIMTTKKS